MTTITCLVACNNFNKFTILLTVTMTILQVVVLLEFELKIIVVVKQKKLI